MRILGAVLILVMGCCKETPPCQWVPRVTIWNQSSNPCQQFDNDTNHDDPIEITKDFCRSGRGILIGVKRAI